MIVGTGSSPIGPAARPLSIVRRLACMLYEAVLLFGVVMVFGYLYAALTLQRHALQGSGGLQAFLFVVLGAYFVGFWSRGGQTLAMKTWYVRVERRDGGPVPPWRAFMRYVLSWLWFLPALASAHYAGVHGTGATVVVVVTGMICYAVLARLRADRQFLHDVACGTRLVDLRPRPQVPAQSTA